MGVSLRELVEKHGGGVWKGRKAKAVNPGGISMGFVDCNAPLTGEDGKTEYDILLDFNGPGRVGCLGLGTAAVTVIDDQTSMVDVLHNTCQFFSHELRAVYPVPRGDRLDAQDHRTAAAGLGRREDLDILVDVADRIGIIPGTTICGLSDGAGWPVKTAIRKFRQEFEDAIRTGRQERGEISSHGRGALSMARHRNDDEDRRDDRRGRRRDRDDWDDGPRSGRRRDEPRHSPAANVLVLAVARFVGVLAFVGAGLLVRHAAKPKAPVPPPGWDPGAQVGEGRRTRRSVAPERLPGPAPAPVQVRPGPRVQAAGLGGRPCGLQAGAFRTCLPTWSPGGSGLLGPERQPPVLGYPKEPTRKAATCSGSTGSRRSWTRPASPARTPPSPRPRRRSRPVPAGLRFVLRDDLDAQAARAVCRRDRGAMPPSFDEFPKFHEGIREHDEFFRAVEEGKIVVRWGRRSTPAWWPTRRTSRRPGVVRHRRGDAEGDSGAGGPVPSGAVTVLKVTCGHHQGTVTVEGRSCIDYCCSSP